MPKGTVTAAVRDVGTPSGFPPDALWASMLPVVGVHEVLIMVDYDAKGVSVVKPWLAESWTQAPDFSYTEFKLRKGIQFHQGFGEFTADDVEYTFKAGDPKWTPGAAHDTLGDPALKEPKAMDKYTVRFYWNAFNARTMIGYTDQGEGIGVFPKAAFTQKGEAWMRTHIIGTGPFEMEEWTALKGIYVKAAPGQHWRKTPYVERIRYLQIPEASTRLAMLQTGEADIGEIEQKDVAGLVKAGKHAVSPETVMTGYMIMWSGQYWQRVDSLGNQLKYEAGGTRSVDISKPWLGDPFEKGDKFDENTPSMQKSRLVRWALTMAIDRKAINDVLLQGMGIPYYVGRMAANDPLITANQAKYTIPYDIAKAKQYLKDAGYEKGFKMPWFVGPSGLEVEISEAVAAGWLTNLNVQVEFDRQTYSSWRPGMINRTARYPQTRNCCGGPANGIFEHQVSAVTPTGYNDGMESPVLEELYYKKVKTTDEAELDKLTLQTIDYIFYWQLNTGMGMIGRGPVYNKDKLVLEKVRPCLLSDRVGQIRQPEYIRIK